MRILHTADWHLGRTIRGRSRRAEFEAVLAEIVEVAEAERVDLVLVCGDIHDSTSPAPDTERLLYDVLRELIGRRIQVVLLGGNHDSSRRLGALGRLSELLGVYAQPEVRRADRGGVLTITAGGETAAVAAVPWVPERFALDASDILGPEHEARQAYHDRVADVYAHMAGGFTPETVNLFAGHVFVDGASVAAIDGSERRLHIEQTYAVKPQSLPSTPQYVALGHVHQPQQVLDAPVPTFYAGSLLQLDFGERGQQKVVRVVEAHPGRPAEHRAVALSGGRRLLEVRGPLDEVRRRAEAAGDAFLRAVLVLDEPEPGLAQRLRDDFPGIVDVRLEYRYEDAEPDSDLAHLSPEELFARYYRAQHGTAPNEEMLALFREVMAEAQAEAVTAE